MKRVLNTSTRSVPTHPSMLCLMWGYNEDQVALVISDSTGFGSQVPVTLSTPTINQIINMVKESEINEL